MGSRGSRYAIRPGSLRLSWQIVPRVLAQMMSDADCERARRVSDAMLTMVKFDIRALQAAYDGTTAPKASNR
jgi:ABC-type xylose transport system substrate-binding protein